jgi:hypothetical protein
MKKGSDKHCCVWVGGKSGSKHILVWRHSAASFSIF